MKKNNFIESEKNTLKRSQKRREYTAKKNRKTFICPSSYDMTVIYIIYLTL